MLLHYLGKLEVQIWWRLHCAPKMRFILLALTRWNLDRFSQFFHCWRHSEHLSICKEDEARGKLENLLQKYLGAVQCASVRSCARRLLKHFSYRSVFMRRTTDGLGMSVLHDMSHTVLGAGPLDSEPYRSPGDPCGHLAVCRCPDVCPLYPCLWAC